MSDYRCINRIGFIGMGNMAQALVGGFIKSEKINSDEIYAYAPNQDKLGRNAEKYGFNACESVNEVLEKCDSIIIACKPYQIEGVFAVIDKNLLKGKALISVAAGWDYDKYQKHVDETVRVQFIMPNTPAMVSEGVFLFEEKSGLEDVEKEEWYDLFSSIGLVAELPTNLMGIGGAISGCGPAFVDLFIEAYADAAVKYGIPRATAYKLISQTVLGSAKLQLKTGEHPGVLKDNVCSPAGTTICGVAALEKAGFRSACIESIDAIMNKKTN